MLGKCGPLGAGTVEGDVFNLEVKMDYIAGKILGGFSHRPEMAISKTVIDNGQLAGLGAT